MANSDKDILITTNKGASSRPVIKFAGANNTPIYAYVSDDGTVNFEGASGQILSLTDGLTGTVFSVNDISGLPALEVLDTGMTKVTGSLSRGGVKEVNAATYTVTPFDNHIVVTYSSTCTLTLPPPGQYPGRELYIKTGSNSITVNSSVSNISQRNQAPTTTTTTIISGAGLWSKLVSNGSIWITMMSNY